jgi:nucleoside-diphosphate-sugar epimerase
MPAIGQGSIVAVTGANGFIGSHICKKLLEDGFVVRAVVRDPADASKVNHLLSLPDAASRLQCVKGDLMQLGGYDDAFAGAAAVVHTAAVVEVLDNTDAENKIVRPAVEGTKNTIAAAKKAGIQRLVMTSSVAAVQSPLGLPDEHTYSEQDWNGWSTVETDPYGYAKTQQERLLWDALGSLAPLWGGSPSDGTAAAGDAGPAPLDAVAIHPSVTLGPALTKAHTKSSTVLVREVLFGNKLNNYNTSFVDVRDVAAAASAALTCAAAGGQRFIVTGDEGPMNTLDLGPVAQRVLPDYTCGARPAHGPWLIWFLARLGFVSAFQESQFSRKYTFSNARLKAVLGVQPRPLEETVHDAALAMIANGWVKPRPAR